MEKTDLYVLVTAKPILSRLRYVKHGMEFLLIGMDTM